MKVVRTYDERLKREREKCKNRRDTNFGEKSLVLGMRRIVFVKEWYYTLSNILLSFVRFIELKVMSKRYGR
jgi:hypothetical protein